MNNNLKVAKQLIKLAKNLMDHIAPTEEERLDEAEKAGKKYILWEKKENLWRIKACKNFGRVKKGDLGGFVESEENLSHKGKCWVFGGAKVYGNGTKVYGNACIEGYNEPYESPEIYGGAKVYGNASVDEGARIYGANTEVYENAQIWQGANIHDGAKVYGHAHVFGGAEIYNNAKVYGNAEIYDDAKVYGGGTEVYGNARLYQSAKVPAGAKVFGFARIDDEYTCDPGQEISMVSTGGIPIEVYLDYEIKNNKVVFNTIYGTDSYEVKKGEKLNKFIKCLKDAVDSNPRKDLFIVNIGGQPSSNTREGTIGAGGEITFKVNNHPEPGQRSCEAFHVDYSWGDYNKEEFEDIFDTEILYNLCAEFFCNCIKDQVFDDDELIHAAVSRFEKNHPDQDGYTGEDDED